MNGAFYIGATGLDAQQRALDVIANNLTNMNTPAFKRSVVSFGELVSVQRSADDLPIQNGDGVAGLTGVKLGAVSHAWTPGELKQTANPLDLAIDGSGFIEMAGPSGQLLLSRGGSLQVDGEGYLVDAHGTRLRGMISVPEGSTGLTIARDGTVSAVLTGQTSAREIGHIDLVEARDPSALTSRGNGYYEVADDSAIARVTPGEDGAGSFVQNAVEQGNVNLSDEMVTMMLVQRAYAASAQAVQAGDQLMSITNGLVR